MKFKDFPHESCGVLGIRNSCERGGLRVSGTNWRDTKGRREEEGELNEGGIVVN
jgi:hypothetical protein